MTGTVNHDDATVDIKRQTTKRANKEAAGEASRDVVKLSEVKKSVYGLVVLYRRKADASAAYKDSIAAVAQRANVGKKVLGKYIKARADDKVKETHAAAEQLSSLFEFI